MWLVSADVTGERDQSRIGLDPTSMLSPNAWPAEIRGAAVPALWTRRLPTGVPRRASTWRFGTRAADENGHVIC